MDEIQELKGGAGERAFLSFLGRLANEIGVPVVMVGGVDALPILRAQFRLARRGQTEGDILLDRSRPGAEWARFVERLWRFQVTRTETPLNNGLLDALMDGSQGITDYMVKLYKQAQLRAMALGGEERITPELISSAAEDSQVVGQSVMKALRSNDKVLLHRLGDVIPMEGMRTIPFAREDAPEEVAVEQGPGGSEPVVAVPDHALTGVLSSNEATGLAPAPAGAPITGRRKSRRRHRARVPDRPGSIPTLVAEAKESGEDPYDVLVRAGLIDGEPWRKVMS
jgi:hypothetical protein